METKKDIKVEEVERDIKDVIERKGIEGLIEIDVRDKVFKEVVLDKDNIKKNALQKCEGVVQYLRVEIGFEVVVTLPQCTEF